ncbi:MAG: hypothetical protein ACXVAY_20925 [Mucilaginibacter sp.]
MNKNLLVVLLLLVGMRAAGQMVSPEIKKGTIINYNFHLHGQSARFTLLFDNVTDSLKLKWGIRYLAGGTYIITPKSWQNAVGLNWVQPEASKVVLLPDDQTFCMLSKNAFHELVTNHRFTYNNTVYNFVDDAKTNAVMMGDQQVDALHVKAEGDTTEFWILNNPSFPLLCKVKDNPLGIDIDLISVK